MSHPTAIAAVTETLRSLIAKHGIVPDVTTVAPDKAADPTKRVVNLFLYHVGINAGLRNQEFPWQSRGGGDSQATPPPFLLPLQLHYLLTAFAEEDVSAHEALGHAMRVLHDHSQLTAAEIQDAVNNSQISLPDSDLHMQPERVKVSMQAMGTEEMTKIWTAFQSPYRLSIAYEVSVVLIDSKRPTFTPKPVLRRGATDEGVITHVGNATPVLTGLFREGSSAPFTTGFAGDSVTIEGVNLGAAPVVRLRSLADVSAQRTTTVTALRTVSSAQPGPGDRCQLVLNAADMPASGPIALCIEYPVEELVPDPANPGNSLTEVRQWHSNEVTLSIAARITGLTVTAAAGGFHVIATQLSVPIMLKPASNPPESLQRLTLLMDGRETEVKNVDLSNPSQPEFTIFTPSNGSHGVRLRVDGVDMPVIKRNPNTGLFEFEDDPSFSLP